MTWVYRSLCALCLASYYWSFYLHAISWRLLVTGVLVFILGAAATEVGSAIFIVLYPVLLYLNQYPVQGFSTATFLAVSLVFGLSLRMPGKLWVPLAIIFFYFCISFARYRPDWSYIVDGVWTTKQTSPSLFVGTCVMWAAGIMLFDFLRQFKPSSLYYALLAQGAVFAMMAVANIAIRLKKIVQYEFLFGDVNAFAAYLILQTGLLAGLVYWKRTPAWWAAASILFGIDLVLLVASYSRAGLIAYFAAVLLYLVIVGRKWIHRHNTRARQIVAVAVLIVGGLAVYERSTLLAATVSVYQEFKPILPTVVRQQVTGRIVDLHNQFSTRIRLITWADFYRWRFRPWLVPLAIVRDYPVFGIGMGAFYRNSEAYARSVSVDMLAPTGIYPENAHNYYLQIAAETGLAGIGILVSFLVWLFSKHMNIGDPIKLGCGIGLVGLMIFSVVQHPLLVDRTFFVFVTICGVLAGDPRHGQEGTINKQPETAP